MVNACKHLVIGGGILGSSLAYKLAESMVLSEGQSSVYLLEKNTVASGTTSKSAGIIIKNHKTNMGSRLASKTLHDIHHFCHSQHFNSFSKVGTHNHVTNTTTPDDGYVDPYQLTQCYMKGAQRFGVKVFENCPVYSIEKTTNKDKRHLYIINKAVVAENVYNATGFRAYTIANCGDENKLPVAYMRSHYWEFYVDIKRQSSLLGRRPILLLPGIYIKFQNHKFEVGIQEKASLIINDPIYDTLPSEQEALGSLIEQSDILQGHIPNFKNSTLRNYTSGISTYTADGMPIIDIGERDKDGNITYLTISGCNGYGITWAGGLSSMIAEKDISSIEELDSKRFQNLEQGEIIELAQNIRHKKVSS